MNNNIVYNNSSSNNNNNSKKYSFQFNLYILILICCFLSNCVVVDSRHWKREVTLSEFDVQPFTHFLFLEGGTLSVAIRSLPQDRVLYFTVCTEHEWANLFGYKMKKPPCMVFKNETYEEGEEDDGDIYSRCDKYNIFALLSGLGVTLVLYELYTDDSISFLFIEIFVLSFKVFLLFYVFVAININSKQLEYRILRYNPSEESQTTLSQAEVIIMIKKYKIFVPRLEDVFKMIPERPWNSGSGTGSNAQANTNNNNNNNNDNQDEQSQQQQQQQEEEEEEDLDNIDERSSLNNRRNNNDEYGIEMQTLNY
ncbi:hypothetical protein PPL_05810 [Heterostelium album PN500]|uniref:Uncharacterized protein n=1 Tax=Heterostelium pallidum (strain ATCC 26659 / Pp 5 / PN500) TaxID=670386 RepID=D3BBE4_HETP5|nr:hypothetical protein PPL_05810 [Heterostelium album PN500]EFA80977.1 hypothetical protein PPL_05810 [Heterostelium album PN500]|eukprot:XP_020433095.1 hypothetical protein PPL_05810 [Heterostelium album PN500]